MLAFPEELRVSVPSKVRPSKNATVPVGIGSPVVEGVTDTEKDSVCPRTAGEALQPRTTLAVEGRKRTSSVSISGWQRTLNIGFGDACRSRRASCGADAQEGHSTRIQSLDGFDATAAPQRRRVNQGFFQCAASSGRRKGASRPVLPISIALQPSAAPMKRGNRTIYGAESNHRHRRGNPRGGVAACQEKNRCLLFPFPPSHFFVLEETRTKTRFLRESRGRNAPTP